MVRHSHPFAGASAKPMWIYEFAFDLVLGKTSLWLHSALGTVSTRRICQASPSTLGWFHACNECEECTKAMNRTTFEWIMVDEGMWSENDVYKWMHKKAIRDSHVRCADRKYMLIAEYFILLLNFLVFCIQAIKLNACVIFRETRRSE